MTDKESLADRLISLQEHKDALRDLIREISRRHPENCTPTLYAQLQAGFISQLECYLRTIDTQASTIILMYQMKDVYNGGVMPDISKETMEELSHGFTKEPLEDLPD